MPAKRRTRLVRTLPKGQVTIPVAFRRELGIGEDTLLSMTLREGKIEMAPHRPAPQAQLREYSDADIRRFLKEDRIDAATARRVRQLLKKREAS